MRTEFILMIVGIVIVVIASCLLVVSGTFLESSEENEKQAGVLFLFIGMLILVIGTALLSACFYKFGSGNPRFLLDTRVNHIYEVKGTVSEDEEKIITVLKEQSGKIRLFEFKSVPEAKFIKIIRLEKGEKAFESFPPSKETSSSEKTSVVKDS